MHCTLLFFALKLKVALFSGLLPVVFSCRSCVGAGPCTASCERVSLYWCLIVFRNWRLFWSTCSQDARNDPFSFAEPFSAQKCPSFPTLTVSAAGKRIYGATAVLSASALLPNLQFWSGRDICVSCVFGWFCSSLGSKERWSRVAATTADIAIFSSGWSRCLSTTWSLFLVGVSYTVGA